MINHFSTAANGSSPSTKIPSGLQLLITLSDGVVPHKRPLYQIHPSCEEEVRDDVIVTEGNSPLLHAFHGPSLPHPKLPHCVSQMSFTISGAIPLVKHLLLGCTVDRGVPLVVHRGSLKCNMHWVIEQQ